jgi:hypothetical protein
MGVPGIFGHNQSAFVNAAIMQGNGGDLATGIGSLE